MYQISAQLFVFAGISSALSFFSKLAGETDRCRIIVISNEEHNKETTYEIEGYSDDPNAPKTLFFASNGKVIPVSRNDVFVFTSWKTAIAFIPVLKWQMETFGLKNRKAAYLIQDFEPGFFAWSTEYVLADSTYLEMPESIIAIFNSKQLYDFFKLHNYSFAYEAFFTPSLNIELKKRLLENAEKNAKRKKQILIYGRPSELRNAFEIIRYSLEKWSRSYQKAKDWEIISLGEGFEDIELPNNKIVSKGKVSLDEYAEYMLNAYAGISLMVSPHPSYPPLEMSTFGVRTINNQFENKDLSSFNDNIISIKSCSPDLIVSELTRICDEYDTFDNKMSLNKAYLEDSDMEKTAGNVRSYINEMLTNE